MKNRQMGNGRIRGMKVHSFDVSGKGKLDHHVDIGYKEEEPEFCNDFDYHFIVHLFQNSRD